MEEESNEYKKITKENQFDFLFWCMDLKSPSIDGEMFSQLLRSNFNNFIEQNCTWTYGYTLTFDMFKNQNDVRQNIKIEEQRKQDIKIKKDINEKIKPNNREERAKLFAEAASKRMLPKNKKIKKACVKKAWVKKAWVKK